jgi:hypothetical protein
MERLQVSMGVDLKGLRKQVPCRNPAGCDGTFEFTIGQAMASEKIPCGTCGYVHALVPSEPSLPGSLERLEKALDSVGAKRVVRPDDDADPEDDGEEPEPGG